MHTNKTLRVSRNRRRKKARRVTGLPVLFFGLFFAIVLIVSSATGSKLKNKYVFSNDFYGLFEEAASHATAFASDLSIVSSSIANEDSELISANTGLLISNSNAGSFYAKNAFERIYPASTTKIMTALLVLENASLDDEVEITADAMVTVAGASLAGLRVGDRISVRQLLYGLMLPSGNEAANALAIHVSGSVDRFVSLMNSRASQLAATGTNFTNPSGLPNDEHYTTAYDMYLILHEAMKYRQFREISSTREYEASYKDKDDNDIKVTWKNSNQYLTGGASLRSGLSIISGKTGTTVAAGNCLAMGVSDSLEYIAIVMKADSKENLYIDMNNILEKIPS